jgi:hypothetical protein
MLYDDFRIRVLFNQPEHFIFAENTCCAMVSDQGHCVASLKNLVFTGNTPHVVVPD